jgi:hypothetical protein
VICGKNGVVVWICADGGSTFFGVYGVVFEWEAKGLEMKKFGF